MEISRYLVILFFPTVFLFSTFTEPIRWEWQTGYRTDSLHWHAMQGKGQRLSHLQFWENALVVCAIYRDLAVYAKGAGGFGTKGATLDALGTFGYTVQLTPQRTYQVLLIPFLGYGLNEEWLNSHLMMKWFGPLIGGEFRIHPGGPFQFDVSYAYHWLHLRFSQSPQKVKANDGNNLGQSGLIRMDYVQTPYRYGILAQIQYFSSRFLHASVQGSSEIFKARWTALSVAAIFSRRF